MLPQDIVSAYLARKARALVEADRAFFEATLHPKFVYVNTRGVRFDKAGYIAQFSSPGGLKFVSQDVLDLAVNSVGDTLLATMKVQDVFENGGVRTSHLFHSMCVFQSSDGACLWLGGQTMMAAV